MNFQALTRYDKASMAGILAFGLPSWSHGCCRPGSHPDRPDARMDGLAHQGAQDVEVGID
jgi:hypothetical protein